MADGFKIADAYVEIEAEVDRDAVRTDAQAAGDDAGEAFVRGVDGKLRDSRGRFVKGFGDTFGSSRKPAEDSGSDGGRGFLDNFGKAFGGGFVTTITAGIRGSGFSSAFAANPAVASAGVALAGGIVVAALPAIGAGLTAGLGASAGLGTIVAGVVLAASRSPEIQAAAGELGKSIMGVDLAPLEEAYAKAQDRLTEAVRSGSKTRIAEAQREVAETKKALDEAHEFNDGNASLPDMARGAFTKPMLDAINTLKSAWADLAPSFGQAFQTVAPYIGPLTDGFVGLVKNAMPGFLKFLDASGPLLGKLGEHMPAIGAALGKFFELLSDKDTMDGAVKFLGDLLDFLQGQIVLWGVLIGWLSSAYNAIHDFFAAIPGWLESAGKWFSDTWDKIKGFFSGLWDSAGELASSFGDKLQEWVDAVGRKVDDVVAWFEALPDRVIAWLEALPGRMGDWASTAFDNLLYWFGYGVGTMVDFFINLPDRVVTGVSTLGEKLSAWWTTTSTNVKTWISTTVDEVVDFWTKLPDRASSAVSSLWDKLSGWFSTTKTNASNTASSMVSDVVAWLQGLPGRAADAISGLAGRIRGAVSGAGSWLVEAGKDILRGLVNGIENILGWAVDMAKRAAHKIADGFKDALGIQSPSTLMRDEVGAQLPPGVVEGFQGALPAAQRELAGLTRQMVGPVATTATLGAAASGGAGGGVTIGNLTLQGVWDFTDPGAVRRMVANLHEALAAYEKEYA